MRPDKKKEEERKKERKDVMERQLFAGGVSVGLATAFTNPIDVVKVRMQVTQQGRAGLVETGYNLVTKEGMRGLTGGLEAAVLRGVTYGGIRLGLYEPVKPFFGADHENAGVTSKVLASCFTGATASLLTNPLDLVKTRNQITGGGIFNTLVRVVQEEGATALWRGCIPGVTRASILTSSQLVTYSEAKKGVMKATNMGECFATHLCTSMVTGLVATTATNPVDVIKTRMYASPDGTSIMKHLVNILTREGAAGLFKGWSASYTRIGPQTAITFLVYEQMRNLVGLHAL